MAERAKSIVVAGSIISLCLTVAVSETLADAP
jgi:hypothetical protein